MSEREHATAQNPREGTHSTRVVLKSRPAAVRTPSKCCRAAEARSASSATGISAATCRNARTTAVPTNSSIVIIACRVRSISSATAGSSCDVRTRRERRNEPNSDGSFSFRSAAITSQPDLDKPYMRPSATGMSQLSISSGSAKRSRANGMPSSSQISTAGPEGASMMSCIGSTLKLHSHAPPSATR